MWRVKAVCAHKNHGARVGERCRARNARQRRLSNHHSGECPDECQLPPTARTPCTEELGVLRPELLLP
jgi:hypothetical protein